MGKKFDQEIIFILFSVFNAILGLSGIAVIGGGIYLVVKLEFNQYIVIIIGLCVIITTIFVIGLFTRKKDKVLFIYIILIIVIFILEIALDIIINFMKKQIHLLKRVLRN